MPWYYWLAGTAGILAWLVAVIGCMIERAPVMEYDGYD